MDDSLPDHRICPSCHNPVEPGHKFCQVCGTRMPELPVCRNCRSQFLAPVKFCEMCGTQVAEPEMALASSDPPIVPAGESESVPAPVLKTPELSVRKDHKPSGLVAGDDPLAPEFSGLAGEPAQPKPAAAPVKAAGNKAAIIGGIVLLIVIAAAGVYVIGLPFLKGSTPEATPSLPPASGTKEPFSEPALQPTTPPAPPLTTIPRTPAYSPASQPTQLIPKSQEVFFDVQKDQVNGQITILFQGGPGINSISRADVRVTSPGGIVKTGTITPSSGQSELVILGSKGADRVEVVAIMYSGQTYRLKDELLEFKGI